MALNSLNYAGSRATLGVNEGRSRPVEKREAEDASYLEALRSAVNIGIVDIEAGRFKTFGSTEALRIHVKSLTAKVISEV